MESTGLLRRKGRFAVLVIFILSLLFSNGLCHSSLQFASKSQIQSDILRHRFVRSLTSSPAALKDVKKDPFLKIVEDMHNQTLKSGGKATFKCKVDGYPKQNLVFTWYKNNQKLNTSSMDPRMKIRNRDSVSRLQIYDVYSSDSGLYRCEASNVERRVHVSAYLDVSFNLLPDDTDTEIDTEHLKGRCEVYTGVACQEYLEDQSFYIESFENQETKEGNIKAALDGLANLSEKPTQCQLYAKKAFCYYVFPPCMLDVYKLPLDDAKPKKLCREDCELLKHDVCKTAFFQQQSNPIISAVVNEANCSGLPATTRSAENECTSIGLPSVVNREHKCFSENGESYRGTIGVTVEGNKCQTWPTKMLSKNPELSGGHNFCRNPGGVEDEPWCFVDKEKKVREKCQVPACGSSRMLIMIAAIAVPILIISIGIVVFCCACRRKGKNVKHTKGIQMDNKNLSAKKIKVPELSGNLVHITGELGDGKFGKVFKAQILSNLHYCPNDPVAVKTLIDRATVQQVQDFQLEMETFSALQHPNVACLKAVVVQLPLRCMIFEYMNGIDLQEYLVMHSPQADFAKPPGSVSSHASSVIESSDFIRMAVQVTAGMEYLTSNNFIHRDLATRNVLVFGRMDLKICNLGVVKESYLASYYRSPQGGQMLPIRWMAPESLHSWKFSDKSTVWSFGVLLWEMFSYGLQPYCGYSNHEVLDMISARQLLACPDQCPAKIYSLMQECWAVQPTQRPQFKEIHAKLVGWEGTSTTRMTSQLAQGIHRQLNNVVRDGSANGQCTQYGSQHRAGDENRYTPYPYPGATTVGPVGPGNRESASSSFGGTPVPSYNAAVQQHYPGHPPPPHHAGYPHPVFPNYSSPPSRSSGSIASSDFTHHQPLRVNNLTSHQEVPEPQDSYPLPPPPQQHYPPAPERTSRPSIDNRSNPDHSFANPFPNSQPQLGMDDMSESQQRHSRPNSRMRPDGSLPLSVYQDQGRTSEGENRSPVHARPLLSPKPSTYYTTSQADRNQSTEHQTRNGVEGRRSGGVTEANGKARSCDSGLPFDDGDSEGVENHRLPLLSNNSGHAGIRSTMKHPSILPSASSSVSGSTQITVDTRIS